MHLVGSAEHYRVLEGRRMHDTLARSGYQCVAGGIPDIEITDIKGDFIIYRGKEGRRDIFAASSITTQEYLILTCRNGLAGLESTIDASAKRMPALLRNIKADPELSRFHEPLSRFY